MEAIPVRKINLNKREGQHLLDEVTKTMGWVNHSANQDGSAEPLEMAVELGEELSKLLGSADLPVEIHIIKGQ